MTPAEALAKIRSLEWTEELRPTHPWQHDILIRKKDVEEILKAVGAS